ncbi:hypothetical protein [Moraxella sp. FZLJ2109]|uniref:hypothetical protein n=1 Tax=Moraxella sp. FZLJ2109 TaxID=2961890 RepID=UPI0020C89E24|nr:hypothetical protein [Moraxella sp. FZLJ2109]UTO21550.1 hypothetical protein NKU06_06795 [Moraxella sp. FZLJ2109]
MAWVILWRWHQLKRLSCQRLNNRPTAQAMPTHGVGAMNKSRATLPIMANTAQWLNNCLSCQHRPPLGVGATAQGIAWVQWFGMGR